MVTASRAMRSRSRIVCVTPFLKGARPDINADLVGAQVGAHMEIRKACALSSQLIEMRSFQKRVPVTGQIAVPLVICHYQDNVGLFARKRPGMQNTGRAYNQAGRHTQQRSDCKSIHLIPFLMTKSDSIY